jgi:hypothetical protein
VFNLLLACGLGVAARGEFRLPSGGRGERPAPVPPFATAVEVEVARGGEVVVPLQLRGPGAILEFKFPSLPRQGRLGEARVVSETRGTVVYRHGGERGSGTDSFTYRIRTFGGVSAAARVAVRVVDAAPVLDAPMELDFGDLARGRLGSRELPVRNVGGGWLEGVVSVGPPWRLEGEGQYALGPGERAVFRIEVDGGGEGETRGAARFSSTPAYETTLRANRLPPVTVEPARVELGAEGGERRGSFRLKNTTGEALAVSLALGARLEGEESVELGPGEAREIAVAVKPGDPSGVREGVRVVGGGTERGIEVVGPPLPAAWSVSAVRLEFAARGEVRPLVVENIGGEPGEIAFVAGAGFRAEGPPERRVKPGERAEWQVVWEGGPRGVGVVRSGTWMAEIGLSGSLPVPVVARPTASPSPSPVAEEEAPREGVRPWRPTVGEIGVTHATLEFPDGGEAIAEYRAEERWLEIGQEKQLVERWVAPGTIRVVREHGRVALRVDGMQAGVRHDLRVIGMGPTGERVTTSGAVGFSTRPKGGGGGSGAWFWGGVAAAVIAAGIAWRFQRRKWN